MHEHQKSERCRKIRQAQAASNPNTPTIQDLFKHGTKTGNRRKIVDIEMATGFDQAQFDEYFLKGLLAVNLPFNVANNQAFRRAFKYARPDVQIPAPTTITRRLHFLGTETIEYIKDQIPIGTKISLAADVWTSPNKIAFLSIVAYWITDMWELKEALIGFEEIDGAHTGENMASIIERVLVMYDIRDRILGFTSDNASNNGTLAKSLTVTMELLNIEWPAAENHIPCMAHVVQLILAAFMRKLQVSSKDGQMPSAFKESYIEKVTGMKCGFHKTIEKVC